MKSEKPVVIITGGTRGIGAAAAALLADRGYQITIAARNKNDDSQAVKSEIEAVGSACLDLYGDIRNKDFCEEIVTRTVDCFGRVDALIHSAGGANPGSIFDEDTITEAWYEAFNIHVHSAFHLTRKIVPIMKKSGTGGALVFIASSAALRGLPNVIPYSSAKGALYQFSRALAAELAEYNIRVNTVSPGMIETSFHKNLTPEGRDNNINNRIPLKRVGTAEEVAELITILIENSYITGENVTIDGGLTMRVR